MKRFLTSFFSLAISLSAQGAVFQQFAPATGVLKGNTNSYITTAATSTDIIAMWTGTCNSTTVLRADGGCNFVNLVTNVSGVLPVVNGGSGTSTPSLVAGTNIGVSGSWPNQTIGFSGILSVANGGTGTATPSLVAGTNISVTGTWPNQTVNSTGASFANPTAVIGLTANNGVASTAARSDSSPALSQAIVPTWTGAHTFTQPLTLTNASNTELRLTNTGNSSGNRAYNFQAESGGNFSLNACDDTWSSCNGFISGNRVGNDITSVALQSSIPSGAGIFSSTADSGTSTVQSVIDVTAPSNAAAFVSAAGTSTQATLDLSADSPNGLKNVLILGTATDSTSTLDLSASQVQAFAVSPDTTVNGELTTSADDAGALTTIDASMDSGNTAARLGLSATVSSGITEFLGVTENSAISMISDPTDTTIAINADSPNTLKTASISWQATNAASSINLAADTVTVNSGDITPSSGSGNVASTTGCTTSPTPTYTYQKIGKIVALVIFSFNCTSNANTFTLTGLPAAVRPASTAAIASIATAEDNSTAAIAGAYVNSSGVLTFYRNGSATGWTSSGVKGLLATAVITYTLD